MTRAESSHHQELAGFIWSIADKLRGPYRPPQYRRVMLPSIVLQRLDAVLEPTKQAAIALLKEYRTALITNAVTSKIDVRQVPIP